MKKLMFFVFVSISGLASAQTVTYQDFKIEEQQIIYQKIFSEDSISVAKLEKYYKTLPFVVNVATTATGLTLNVEGITVDYKKFQFSQVGTPMIIQSGNFSGEVSIGVKDGKYRVTFRSIQLTGNIEYKMIKEKDNLTNYACKNSGTVLSENWCRPNMLGLLDQAFTDKFQFKKSKDDW
ncbi:MAG: hypothetical protein HOP08_09295 [Cyclobacteriaceae bacterium]|nr:hypothetical protein [Cyclobacteriaceae bacterium]